MPDVIKCIHGIRITEPCEQCKQVKNPEWPDWYPEMPWVKTRR